MIETRSKFYYIDGIELDNRLLNYDEGLGELTATLIASNYSPTQLAVEVSRSLTESGTQIYDCTYNRTTRKFTISSIANFDLLAATGSNVGLSAFSLLGFTSDKTGANTYESDVEAGYEYKPQVKFQNYEDDENNEEGIDPSVNESSSGVVETITFGDRSFIQMNIKYITDSPLQDGHEFENNQSAVSEARAFMKFLAKKNRVELMKDRDDVNSFVTLLLDKTPESSTGTGFKLKEISKFKGLFETGKLKFRKI